MAAPKGNQHAVKAKRWTLAIENALSKRSKGDGVKALEALAEKLLALADHGELGALRELGDRLDGKPHQTIAADVDSTVTVEVVRYGDIKAA